MDRPDTTFECPKWPGCGCPDGAVHPDCPALAARRAVNWPQQAGILCNDLTFQKFIGSRLRLAPVSPEAAAEYLRCYCNIPSRRDLATNSEARIKFRILRTEYDAWRGRIASPR